MATDKQGRTYARLSELKAGDRVRVDGDFTCMRPWGIRTVEKDARGKLYIGCDELRHYLGGQADNGEDLIGVYKL